VALASQIFRADLLAGQAALITGGGTGLGRAAARELVSCGADVVLAGRRAEVLEEAAADIGDGATAAAGDIREPDDATRLVDEVLERHGRLDLLVNNAGGQFFAPAETIEAKGWNAVWRLNVDGTLRMAEAAADRAMRPAGRGTIVNVTLSPHHGLPGMTHSSAARAAVEGLTRELAAAWAGEGVAVIAAAAGHFETEVLSKYPEPVRRNIAATVPLQRLGRPEEHAWLIALLASPIRHALNGSTVTLDGGRDNWFGPWPPPGLRDDHGQVPTEARRPTPLG
jgi:citronellol/citronellal dehydrogenase